MKKDKCEIIKQLYNYIVDRYNRDNIIPSIREMCEKFNIKSTATVYYYLKQLEENNLIIRHGKLSRGIQLVNYEKPLDDKFLVVPEIGVVSAGAGMFAEESYVDTHNLSRTLFPRMSGELFMLKVQGMSMRDVGIYDGDYIIVRKQDYADNKEIVVAMIDNENATVKRFIRNKDGSIRLHPENSAMEDIIPESLNILGKVIGLVRTKM
ncbi:MAG: transcriptional repressor LexA [Christensenellaceae bacterium]|jgi:repressor LexA|nr:transcriptional repressor LexA [Christensenellaceae bacterium]